MTGFWRCGIYFAITGTFAFFAGRIVPKHWFCFDRFPYKCMAFEQSGKIYDRIRIRKWLNKVPDMSRIFKCMPAKKITGKLTPENLHIMIRETCVAECVHGILNITGLGCFLLWDSGWCIILYGAYVLLGNLPFMLIQRHTRPRLVRILHRYETKGKEAIKCVC